MSSEPAIACALPDAPAALEVLERLDREQHVAARAWKRSTSAAISSSVVPRASRRWIACESIAIASDAVIVSTTRTLSPPISCAASSALWNVPETFAETWSE